MQLNINMKGLVIAVALGLLGWIVIGALILGWCYAMPGACG